jgi:hypothetical protein
MIDLIVPTVEGREDFLDRCIASFPDANPIVIRGETACGAAWIKGISRSGADYMILCADDIEAHPDLDLNACVEAVDDGYLPAPIVHRPDGSIESAGGDMNAPGCLLTDVQPDWTPVDFTPMPFVSREQIRKVRMIDSHMMCDVWASHRGRQLGYETVLRHPYKLIHHHLEVGRRHGTDPADRLIYQEAMSRV